MRIEQLENLIHVAQYKSLTEAGEHLNMSQQALNASIRKMEDEIGVPLLARTYKGTQLTKEGQIFVKGANKLLVEYYNLLSEIQTSGKKSNEVVRIGISYGLLEAFFSNILAQFYKEDSSIDLHTEELTQNLVLEKLEAGEFHLGVVSFNDYDHPAYLDDDRFSFYPLFRSKIYMRVSKNSPLAQYDTISLKTAVKQNILIYQPKTWGDYVNPICEFIEHFYPECKLFYEYNYQLHHQKLLQGLGVSFTILDNNSGAMDYPGLKLIPLKDDIETICGCLVSNEMLTPTVQYLLNYFRILCANKRMD